MCGPWLLPVGGCAQHAERLPGRRRVKIGRYLPSPLWHDQSLKQLAIQPGRRASDGGGGMSELGLRHVESELEIAACYPVMVLLRPHLASADELVARITRQRDAGYRLLALWRAGTPVALAGYRFEENLIHGKFVYVDDLVTAADERRGGLGARLLDAVATIGRDAGCGRLVLDTALDNVLAHRFYYRQGMLARALRFSRALEPR